MNNENYKPLQYSFSKYSSKPQYLEKIRQLFFTMIDSLVSISQKKSSLISIKDFDSQKLYDSLDSSKKGYISFMDFSNYLKNYSIKYNDQIIHRFIQQYDKQ